LGWHFWLATSATAADLPGYIDVGVPVPGWTGFYAGLDGGYGSGTGNQTAGVGSPDFNPPFSTNAGPPGTLASININGGIFGGHAGYNYQISNWVLSLETSVAWTDISGDAQLPVVFPGFGGVHGTQSYSTDVKWQATTTPRVGFAWNNWLIYGKAGLAAGEVDVSTARIAGSAIVPHFGASIAATQQRVGWTVGVGTEWAMTQNWIFGVEYDYLDFGTQNYAGEGINNAGVGAFDSENVRLYYSEVLARWSYKF
jgi:outer membrane immunogenic protein